MFSNTLNWLVRRWRSVAVACAIVAGILAITPLLASPDNASCTAKAARNAGFSNFDLNNSAKPVPNTAFFDGQGNTRTIADYRGMGVIMNFWATWCPPCVAEMPALDRLKAELTGSNVDVLAISEDRDAETVVEEFYFLNDIASLDVLIDRKSALSRALKVSALPSTLIIDPEGNQIATVIGAAHWDSPEAIAFLKACLDVPSE